MLVNIIDHRSNPYCQSCDCRLTPAALDNGIVGATQTTSESFTATSFRGTDIATMVEYVNAMLPLQAVTLHLYDTGTIPETGDAPEIVRHYQSLASVSEKQIEREDGGMALIFNQDPIKESGPGADGCFFVRLQSWDDKTYLDKSLAHRGMRALIGRRIRVTIDTVG